uniref:protein-serine/threonine phosphatase n=1 Tax=Prasinoderma coloniale TaxID=156133 RepID=A0A7R9TCJ4_9VIRI
MGAYLDKPERGKDSGEGANGAFAYGFSSMQGWRRTQEDAHAAVVDLDGADAAAGAEETGFFAVYDGHGGAAVARYCARHLHAQLRKCDAYKRGDVAAALTETYLLMDEMMATREAELELRELSKDSHAKPQITPLGTSIKIAREEEDGGVVEDDVCDVMEIGVPKVVLDKLRSGSIGKNGDITISVESTPVVGGANDGGEARVLVDAGAAASEVAARAAGAAASAVDAMQTTPDNGSIEKKRARAADGAADEHGIERDEDEGKRACNSSAGEGGDDEEGIYVTPPGQTVATADDLLPPTTGGLVSGPAAGCTAVVAVVRGNSLVVANCGDSRCVLSRGGAAVALSRDHKPEDPEELKRIEKAKCFVADGRVNGVLNLSRAIGDSEFKQSKEVPAAEQAVTAMPEIMTQTLRLSADASEGEDADALDEFLVLGCDGIFDVKTNQEVVDFVREQLAQGTGLREAAEALLDDCLAPDCGGSGVGCDNMSAVVVTFGTQAQAFPGGEHAERLKASGGAKVVGGSSGADGGGLPPLASALSMTRR